MRRQIVQVVRPGIDIVQDQRHIPVGQQEINRRVGHEIPGRDEGQHGEGAARADHEAARQPQDIGLHVHPFARQRHGARHVGDEIARGGEKRRGRLAENGAKAVVQLGEKASGIGGVFAQFLDETMTYSSALFAAKFMAASWMTP